MSGTNHKMSLSLFIETLSRESKKDMPLADPIIEVISRYRKFDARVDTSRAFLSAGHLEKIDPDDAAEYSDYKDLTILEIATQFHNKTSNGHFKGVLTEVIGHLNKDKAPSTASSVSSVTMSAGSESRDVSPIHDAVAGAGAGVVRDGVVTFIDSTDRLPMTSANNIVRALDIANGYHKIIHDLALIGCEYKPVNPTELNQFIDIVFDGSSHSPLVDSRVVGSVKFALQNIRDKDSSGEFAPVSVDLKDRVKALASAHCLYMNTSPATGGYWTSVSSAVDKAGHLTVNKYCSSSDQMPDKPFLMTLRVTNADGKGEIAEQFEI